MLWKKEKIVLQHHRYQVSNFFPGLWEKPSTSAPSLLCLGEANPVSFHQATISTKTHNTYITRKNPDTQKEIQAQGVSKKTEFSRNQLWEIFLWLMRNPIEFFSTNPAVLLWDNVFQCIYHLQHVSDINIHFGKLYIQDLIMIHGYMIHGYNWSLLYF